MKAKSPRADENQKETIRELLFVCTRKRGLYTGTDKRKIHKGRYKQISKSGNKKKHGRR